MTRKHRDPYAKSLEDTQFRQRKAPGSSYKRKKLLEIRDKELQEQAKLWYNELEVEE